MLALSTAWLSAVLDDGFALLDRVKELELISTIELDARLNAAMLDAILMVVRTGEFRVASIHAPCPTPKDAPRLSAAADLQLNQPDRHERARAIEAVADTLDVAAEHEAPVVIIHLGRVDVPGDIGMLRTLYDEERIETEEAEEVRADLLERRGAVAQPYLDAALFSLDFLIKRARQRGVTLALENRLAFHEMPSSEDLALLFHEFRGAPLRFWYDAGHAAVQENLGWTTQRALLEAHRGLLCGAHLHDAKGYADKIIDERRQTDYRLLKEYVRAETPCVIEVEGVETEQLAEYIEFLIGEGFAAG